MVYNDLEECLIIIHDHRLMLKMKTQVHTNAMIDAYDRMVKYL